MPASRHSCVITVIGAAGLADELRQVLSLTLVSRVVELRVAFAEPLPYVGLVVEDVVAANGPEKHIDGRPFVGAYHLLPHDVHRERRPVGADYPAVVVAENTPCLVTRSHSMTSKSLPQRDDTRSGGITQGRWEPTSPPATLHDAASFFAPPHADVERGNGWYKPDTSVTYRPCNWCDTLEPQAFYLLSLSRERSEVRVTPDPQDGGSL